MGNVVAISPRVSKKVMSDAVDSAHLHVEYFGDAVREVSTKIACIGYFIAPRHRAEFLRVLNFIQHDLPMDETSLRAVSVCLDILRARYSA